jgi:anti-anti-sigma factor
VHTTRIDVTTSPEAPAAVRVRGVLDIVSAPELGSALARVIEADHARVVVDCSGLTDVDGDGMRVLLNTRRTLARRRRALVLRDVPATLVDRFVAAGLAGTIEDQPGR